jgi:hypothetical protein
MTEDWREIIERVSELPEEYALMYFWQLTRNDMPPLEALELFTHVKIPRGMDWDYHALRREHQAFQRSGVLHKANCFACEVKTRLFWHHIIELQHGGSNHYRNRVSLCYACHRRLHPWLADHPEGLESVGMILPRVLQRLDAGWRAQATRAAKRRA